MATTCTALIGRARAEAGDTARVLAAELSDRGLMGLRLAVEDWALTVDGEERTAVEAAVAYLVVRVGARRAGVLWEGGGRGWRGWASV